MSRVDFYAVLGVGQQATAKEISKAFRAKARLLHPDKQPPDASAAHKDRAKRAFQEIARAYEVLSDPEKRLTYDLGDSVGGSGSAPSAAPPRKPSYAGSTFSVPKSKAPTETEEQRRQRRWEQQERDKAKNGLGAHWVKPPEWTEPQKWAGWVQSGAGGPAKSGGGDADSDVSSTLSFVYDQDLYRDLNGLDFDNLETWEASDPTVDMLNSYGEVWTVRTGEVATAMGGSAAGGRDAGAGGPVPEGTEEQPGEDGKLPTGIAAERKQPKCCSVQ